MFSSNQFFLVSNKRTSLVRLFALPILEYNVICMHLRIASSFRRKASLTVVWSQLLSASSPLFKTFDIKLTDRRSRSRLSFQTWLLRRARDPSDAWHSPGQTCKRGHERDCLPCIAKAIWVMIQKRECAFIQQKVVRFRHGFNNNKAGNCAARNEKLIFYTQ